MQTHHFSATILEKLFQYRSLRKNLMIVDVSFLQSNTFPHLRQFTIFFSILLSMPLGIWGTLGTLFLTPFCLALPDCKAQFTNSDSWHMWVLEMIKKAEWHRQYSATKFLVGQPMRKIYIDCKSSTLYSCNIVVHYASTTIQTEAIVSAQSRHVRGKPCLLILISAWFTAWTTAFPRTNLFWTAYVQ